MFGNIDLHGAGLVTGAAKAAGLGEVFELGQALKQGRDEGADGTGIDAAVCVAADFAVDGAGIKARPAADAAKRFAVFGVGEDFGSPVVEKNQMEFFRPVFFTGLRGPPKMLV